MIIAACGINCSLCKFYNREKNNCPGCKSTGASMPVHCSKCILRNCEKHSPDGFCSECDSFPCKRMKSLDKRYRLRYHNPLIENLILIKDLGIDFFVSAEEKKWSCEKCGGMICMHTGICLSCKKSQDEKKPA